ncbi:probable inactive heme oxygenase 2, chloroplastic [Neltuma alba]|uniref:probable inactive heme oxygenase 2, chloroplastic n=1 Tax=Neltuma alba TaxID=207710 RepID=UPI0010A32E76|nr:probable inactive heme oxygenase 2, chloroplastic [Prosopis alba]
MWLTAKLPHKPLLRLPFSSPNSAQLKVSTISTMKMRYFQSSIICSDSTSSTAVTSSSPPMSVNNAPPVLKKRKRYRKLYPGESTGITEEMRFVAMRLRNINGKKYSDNENSTDGADNSNSLETSNEEDNCSEDETWQPSMEGFLKYLVDSKLIFTTVERIVDESGDVSYAYFRRNGLERSESLSKDLEWFSQRGFMIPDPSSPGLSYAKYLEELAENSAPLFLCHLYNIYFSHIAGGQVIARKVSEKLLEGKELEFYSWEGDVSESLKGVREKLNMLSEHWTRDEKNRCLKEATKSFRFLGQIVRLIIL